MKTRFTLIAGVLLGAVALVGCVNEGFEKIEKSTTITLTAGIYNDVQTRTDITDPTNPIWSAGDAIGVHFFAGDENVAVNKKLTGSFTPDFSIATFTGPVSGLSVGSNYTIYGYYPYGTVGNLTYDKEVGRIVVPELQKPSATSFDPMADVMIMKPLDFTYDGNAINYSGLQFKRALTTLRIKLNVPELNGEAIERFNFSVNDPSIQLTGSAQFNLVTGEFLQFYGNITSAVKVEPTGDVFANGTDAIYICVPAVTIPAGTQVTFAGQTAHYEFTKTITVPASDNVTFKAGTFFDFNISSVGMDIEETISYDETLNNEWKYTGWDPEEEYENTEKKIVYAIFENFSGPNQNALTLTLADAPPIVNVFDNFLMTYIQMSQIGQEVTLVANDDEDPWQLKYDVYDDGILRTGTGSNIRHIAEGKVFVDKEGNNITYKLAVKFTDGTVLKAHYSGAGIDKNPPAEDVIPGENQLAYRGEKFDMQTLIYLSDREDEGLGGFALVDGTDRGYGTEKQLEVYLPLYAFDGGTTNFFELDKSMWSVKYYNSNTNYFIKSAERSDPGGSMTSGEVTIDFDMMTGNMVINLHFVYGEVLHLRANFNGPLEGL